MSPFFMREEVDFNLSKKLQQKDILCEVFYRRNLVRSSIGAT